MALARVNTPLGGGGNKQVIVTLPIQNGTLTYNGTNQTPAWTNYNPDQITMTGETEASTTGTHTVYCTPTGICVWANGTQETKETTWAMDKAAGILSLSANSAEVKVGATGNVILTTAGDGAISVTSNNTGVATVSRNGNTITITGVKAGTATITVSVAEGTNHLTPSNATCSVTVSKTSVTIPTVTNTSKTYNGSSQSPTVTNEPSSTVATCTGKSATNAGDYTLKYSLTDTNKYVWSDGSTTDKSTSWNIAKANGSVTLSATSGTVTYGTPKTFTVTGNTSGGTLSVSSASTTYATASINGNTVTVNCVKYRSTTTIITVTSAATANYNSATATYTMTAAKATGSLSLSATSGTVRDGETATFTISATGDGAITVTSTNANIATASINGNIVTISGRNVGNATITVSQAAGTNHTAPENKTYEVTVEFNASSTFNDNSWDLIRKIAEKGEGDTYWDIGDAKEITLNGKIGSQLTLTDTKLCVFILHFNYSSDGTTQNNIILGGFKSALTDGKDVALVDAKYWIRSNDGTICFNMNHWGGTNYGGWAGCDFRFDILGATDTQPSDYGKNHTSSNRGYDASVGIFSNPKADTLLAALPSDFRNNLKLWLRKVDAVGNCSNVENNIKGIDDAVTLLSEFEIFGSRTNANQYEQNHQTQMAYYSMGNTVIRYKHDDNTSKALFWACSPDYDSSGYFCAVNNNSNKFETGVTFADDARAIAPAFKMGRYS